MMVFEVSFSDDGSRAFIVLRPSWLERVLFRRPIRTVELVRARPITTYDYGCDYGWNTAITGRSIVHHEYRDLIVSALESPPVGADSVIPFARWIASKP